ncbi:MAG TPA: hypothetical protein PKY29_03575 [Ferruginibacter sp.]|nr:hypothetical protein [Ferruginibacter sp.]HRN79245.1 hypothetical protein [Ferruginibacter sp.]HRO17169.1 hypothetical protein [Ferruginibacter sp.]HRQ20365.1 hypothetical protein [Ferruginibacter sp.]
MQLLKNRKWIIRIIIIITCFIAAMVYQSTRALAQSVETVVETIKIQQAGNDAIQVQVRTSDGKPVQFQITSEQNGTTYSTTLIHSKLTMIKNIQKGNYSYLCMVKDKIVYTGKYSMR